MDRISAHLALPLVQAVVVDGGVGRDLDPAHLHVVLVAGLHLLQTCKRSLTMFGRPYYRSEYCIINSTQSEKAVVDCIDFFQLIII